MVGDDAMARPQRPVRVGRGGVGDRGDEHAEQVDVVVRRHALQQRGGALEPHAGVDRRARQHAALVLRHLLVLHEDEVPELQEPVAVLVRAAGRAAGERVALVVEDLRAGPARPGLAHRPEIVRRRDADDLRLGQAGDLLPESEGLVVVVVDGDEKLLDRQLEGLGDQVPGELDRHVLEVIAEREIAEHLEERVVARGIADVVEVVVLAAGAHAFLAGGGARIGPLLVAGEDVLERHHAGVGEHQRGVVARHERGRRHDLVRIAAEIVEKRRADLVDASADHAVLRAFGPPEGGSGRSSEGAGGSRGEESCLCFR